MPIDFQLPAQAKEREADLRHLMDVFLQENSKLNLSALRSAELCWPGNILDSLPLLDLFAQLNVPAFPKITDIGTGGGFPLLPLALCLPDATLTGIDSIQKKMDAVGRVSDAVGLRNIRLLCGRAEELGHAPTLRETQDLVLARAVAPINVLLEYCAPFAKVGGHVVLWKSLHIDEELHDSLLARAELSCHLAAHHRYDLDGEWGERQLLVFQKSAALSSKYPRDTGVPKKEPLR